MTNLKIWTGVFAFVFVLALMSGTAMAQDTKVQDPKVQDAKDAKIAEGTLMDIDQNAKILKLKSGDNEMQFSYNEQTELVAQDAADGKPPVVKQGTKMRVHYTERENTKMATMIEIIEATAAR
jgi:hypothetical protein